MSSISSFQSRSQIISALNVIGEIFQEEDIKICVKESLKSGLITGVSTIVGGLLGGKTGLLAGGVVGTLAAYNMTPDYKSLIQVIQEMDYEMSKKLFDVIQNLVNTINIADVVKFTLLLSTNQSIKQAVIHETINFIRNELTMQIANQ